jgi:hypothetical protein
VVSRGIFVRVSQRPGFGGSGSAWPVHGGGLGSCEDGGIRRMISVGREKGRGEWHRGCRSVQVRPDLGLEWVSDNEDWILNRLNSGVDSSEV